MQCKQWRAFKVGVDVVRELYGVMAARGATGGFVVTSGRFTDDAISFASGRNVTLVDGPKLVGLIRQARAGAGQPAARMAPPINRTHCRCRVGDRLPVVREVDGAQDRKARRQCGRRVLGLHGLPGMPRYAADRLKPGPPMALSDGLYDLLLTEGLARSLAALDPGSAEVLSLKGGAPELLVDVITRRLGAILDDVSRCEGAPSG